MKTDTPKYYLLNNDQRLAEDTIKTIYECENQDDVDAISKFMTKHSQKATSTVTIKQIFTDPDYTGATWVNLWSVIFHELTGINVIFLYSHTILEQVLKNSTITPNEGVYAIFIINSIASAVAIWTVRTFGRRPLLLFGYSAICITHCILATFILIEFNVGVVLMMCVFMAIYQNTCGPIPWLYAAETMTDVGLGIAMQTLYVTLMIVSVGTEPLMQTSLHTSGVFFLFGLFSLFGFIFTYFFFKETKGLTEKQKKQVYQPQTQGCADTSYRVD